MSYGSLYSMGYELTGPLVFQDTTTGASLNGVPSNIEGSTYPNGSHTARQTRSSRRNDSDANSRQYSASPNRDLGDIHPVTEITRHSTSPLPSVNMATETQPYDTIDILSPLTQVQPSIVRDNCNSRGLGYSRERPTCYHCEVHGIPCTVHILLVQNSLRDGKITTLYLEY